MNYKWFWELSFRTAWYPSFGCRRQFKEEIRLATPEFRALENDNGKVAIDEKRRKFAVWDLYAVKLFLFFFSTNASPAKYFYLQYTVFYRVLELMRHLHHIFYHTISLFSNVKPCQKVKLWALNIPKSTYHVYFIFLGMII